MFKSTLGLGLGSTKKADLTAYLKNLEKKNKEVQRKHSVTGTEDVREVDEEEEKGESSLEEDSDLLSLAREMQEEQYESPFIKRRTEPTAAAATGDGRVPEESEVCFKSSFTKYCSCQRSLKLHLFQTIFTKYCLCQRSPSFPLWLRRRPQQGSGRSSLS